MREGWNNILDLSSEEKRALYNACHKCEFALVKSVEKGWKQHMLENQLALPHREMMSGARPKHQ